MLVGEKDFSRGLNYFLFFNSFEITTEFCKFFKIVVTLGKKKPSISLSFNVVTRNPLYINICVVGS